MTTPLGGTLPFDDNQGSKVPVYNEYLRDYLEAAVIGIDSKNLAGATTAQTLSVTEARNSRHVFTNAGAAIDVKFPLAGTATRFVVKNSSGFTLTIKTDAGGSAGVAVLNGTTRELFINGNDVESSAPISTGTPFVGARVFHNADQSITTATATALAFNSERYDTDVIHDTVTNNSRLTCKTAGKYAIKGHVAYDTNATGYRQSYIRINGGAILANDTRMGVTGDFTILTLSTDYILAVNDYVELICYQTSGGALNVKVATAYSPEFMMKWLGA